MRNETATLEGNVTATEVKKLEPVSTKKIDTKPIKLRVEPIVPSSIVDVWRLYESSLNQAPPVYPSMHEESQEYVRAQLFQSISSPRFLGFLVKHGKKPVGQVSALLTARPCGSPRMFLQLWLFWVEPEYRKQGASKLLKQELFRAAKARGVHYWESITEPHLVDVFRPLGEFKQVGICLSGKITAE